MRQLALAKLRELRGAGMSYRDIGVRFGLGREIGGAEVEGGFGLRIPPGRLLAHPSPLRHPVADQMVFLQALDALDQGLVFFDCGGTLLHANRAFARLLEICPEGQQLRTEVHHFADSICGLIKMRGLEREATVQEIAVRDVPTEQQQYRLRGSFIGLDLFGKGPTTLIALERPTPDPLSDESLRERFGLTRQEARTARLIAQGKSNAEIADRLFISPHTAKHHTKHVLEKLGARARAEVAIRVLQSGFGPNEDEK